MENEAINYINSHHLIWINRIREKNIFTQKGITEQSHVEKTMEFILILNKYNP